MSFGAVGSLNGMTHAPSWFDITATDGAEPLQTAPNDHARAHGAAHWSDAQWGMEIRALMHGGGEGS